MLTKLTNFFTSHIALLIWLGVALLCVCFILTGTKSENGSITLDGEDAKIEEYTEKFIESSNDALYRVMNGDAPTDEETIKANEATGQGAYTTLEQVLGRRLPDGNDDNGRGWQCSKYTAYLATGKREYSTSHPDYGPVNGKDIADWLVKNFEWTYTDTPVQGAIGSGGFNTKYGHTAMFLYKTGDSTAMVNDANWTPFKVATHNMNISGWVWVVPGDYEPTPEPEPLPEPVSSCTSWTLTKGDTLSYIMKTCKGYVDWSDMNNYASKWYSQNYVPGQSVYEGWSNYPGVGLYDGDVIYYKE